MSVGGREDKVGTGFSCVALVYIESIVWKCECYLNKMRDCRRGKKASEEDFKKCGEEYGSLRDNPKLRTFFIIRGGPIQR